MARPIKKGLRYFPFDVNFFYDDKIADLLDAHGPVGLAVYQAILCLVYSNGYYLASPIESVARSVQRMIGSRWVRNRSTVEQVILSCADIGLLDQALLSHSVFTSAGIQLRYAEATVRSGAKVNEYSLITEKNGSGEAGGSAPENLVSVTETQVSATKTPITEAKTNTKEEEIKEDNSSSLARTRAQSKMDLLKLSPSDVKLLVENVSAEALEHYAEAILHCEASGKPYTKTTHAEAIRRMAEADGVWGKLGKKKNAKKSAGSGSFDAEDAWAKAIKKSYGEIL